jgi:DNA-binding beta-propeller fold protein YncE
VNRREFVVGAVTLPLAFRFAAEAQAGGTPVALVTADTESRVVAVDVRSGRLLRSIPTLPGPRSIETARDMAVVCHTALGVVTLVDAARLRVAAVLHDFAEPRYSAAHADGRHVYVTDSAASEVVAVDVTRRRVVGRSRLGGGWARHVTIAPSGDTLWVGLGTAVRSLAVVDVSDRARPRFVRRVTPPWGAHDVGWLPSGASVWVTSGDSHETAVFGLDGRARVRMPAGAPPQHVSFGRGVAYVTSGDDGTLHVHDLHTGRVLRRVRVPVGSYNVQHAGSYVLTPSLARGTLTVLDEGGVVSRVVQVATSSHDACLVSL